MKLGNFRFGKIAKNCEKSPAVSLTSFILENDKSISLFQLTFQLEILKNNRTVKNANRSLGWTGVTFVVRPFRRQWRPQVAEDVTGDHVPDDHLAVVAAGREEVRGTLGDRQDVLTVTVHLRAPKRRLNTPRQDVLTVTVHLRAPKRRLNTPRPFIGSRLIER